MATIAIGDIHGSLPALADVLEQIRGTLSRQDTVVFLGDYIDRGPDSKGCIDAILTFQRDTLAEVVCLLGNHEDWFLRTLHDHRRHSWLLYMGAFETIRSYSADAERQLRDAVAEGGAELILGHCVLPYEVFFDHVPQEHIRFFEGLRLYHRTPDCVCTHGGVDPRIGQVHDQQRESLIWGAGTFPDGYQGADIIMYGHRNNAARGIDGRPMPAVAGRTIGIDTIAHGVLTAVRLPDYHVFQSARYAAHGCDV